MQTMRQKKFNLYSDYPDSPGEIWEPIDGYPNYQISSESRIKHGKYLLTLTIANTGYYCVGLENESGRKLYLVHRLKAAAFIPNPDNLPCINHLDANKLNLALSNMQWCTRADNNKHAREAGLIPIKKAIVDTLVRQQASFESKIIVDIYTGVFYRSLGVLADCLGKTYPSVRYMIKQNCLPPNLIVV